MELTFNITQLRGFYTSPAIPASVFLLSLSAERIAQLPLGLADSYPLPDDRNEQLYAADHIHQYSYRQNGWLTDPENSGLCLFYD